MLAIIPSVLRLGLETYLVGLGLLEVVIFTERIRLHLHSIVLAIILSVLRLGLESVLGRLKPVTGSFIY